MVVSEVSNYLFHYFWCLNFISVSTFTKGEQMIPVLNQLGTHVAVYGNHDFGKLIQLMITYFWLSSIDPEFRFLIKSSSCKF